MARATTRSTAAATGTFIEGGNGKDLIDGGDGIDACYGTSKDVFEGCETVAEAGATPVPAPVDPAPPTRRGTVRGQPCAYDPADAGRNRPGARAHAYACQSDGHAHGGPCQYARSVSDARTGADADHGACRSDADA